MIILGEKVQKNYEKILSPIMIEKIDINENEVRRNTIEFLNTLYEYKSYLNFKYIIEDMKKHYNEKDKYKKSYDDIKKRIMELEKKLKKINKKQLGGIFSKSKQEVKQSIEQNNIILELKKTYKELDLNKFYNKIYTNLNDNSTIYDALNLANSYYNYLTECMIEHDKTIEQKKVDEQIMELDILLKNPFNNILTNLTFIEEKDITLFIKDRYKLLGFSINQEDLNDKNLDNLITILEGIMTIFYLKDAKLEITKIEELLKIKNTL